LVFWSACCTLCARGPSWGPCRDRGPEERTCRDASGCDPRRLFGSSG
jgi:hypothetical protein